MPTQFRRTSRHRGIAMLAALFLCGVVTVLSLAMLAASSAQVRSVDNAARAARADALADSGATLAMYYLLHPEKSPVLLVQASMVDTLYYPGEMNVPLGADGGTADIYVVMVRPYEYRITATGRDGGGEIARRKICDVAVKVDSKPQHAGAFAGSAELNDRWSIAGPGTDVGGVRLEGNLLGNLSPATLTGPAYAANGAAVVGAQVTPVFPRAGAPALSKTKYASRMNPSSGPFTYTYGGQTCYAKPISGDKVTGPLQDNSPNNPANVWYTDGGLKIRAALTLRGTLIVRGDKDLKLQAGLDITPLPGMPAAVIGGDLNFSKPNLRFTSRGYTSVGNQITFKSDDFGGVLDVRGALAAGFDLPPDPKQQAVSPRNLHAQIKLTYDPTVLDLPDFTVPRDAVPVSIEITKWDLKP